MNTEKKILVFADWYIFNSPRYVGTLFFSIVRGNPIYAFEYGSDWLKDGITGEP
jgi:serine/threonine-protein kinase HipA